MADEPTTFITLRSSWPPPTCEGSCCALYLAVSRDSRWAKVGLVSRLDRIEPRLREITRRWYEPGDGPRETQYRMVLAAELVHLVRQPDDERSWQLAQAIEHSMRLCIARQVGVLSEFPEWIEVESPLTTDGWKDVFARAWKEVDSLGRSG